MSRRGVHRSFRLVDILPLAVAVFAIFAPIVSADGATGQSDWKAKLLKDAPVEWKKLESRVNNWGGVFTESHISIGATQPTVSKVLKRTKSYCFNGSVGGKKLIFSHVPDDGKESVYCINPQYAFELAKNGPSQGLYLADYAAHDETAVQNGRVTEKLEESALRFLLAAEYVGGTKLQDLVKGTGGTLQSITESTVNGKLLLRIEFDHKFSDSSKHYSSSATIDPKFNWAVTSYEENHSWGVTKGTIKYQADIRDVAFPKRIVEQDLDASGKIIATTTVEFDPPAPCRATAMDFTLQAFGLEPPHVSGSESASKIWFTLGSVAVLFFLGGLFLWLYFRQRRLQRR